MKKQLVTVKMLPTAPSVDGSNAKEKFHIPPDVTITGTLEIIVIVHLDDTQNSLCQRFCVSGLSVKFAVQL